MARIIDVIDHVNVMDDEFCYREPQRGSGDWRMGSQVIVGESQVAVFVRGGEALDALQTGRHTISVANIPILSGLIGMATSGRTPFTADLYFVNLKEMPQVGWGTSTPIVMETPGIGLGAVLLITHGTMNLSISDPMRFLKKFGIGKPITRLGDIRNALQIKLLGELTVIIAQSGVSSIPQANALLSDLEAGMLARLSESFEAEFGARLNSLDAVPFTAKEAKPDELMMYIRRDELRDTAAMDVWERSRRMDVAETAAGNEGGPAGAMASAGVGLGSGLMMGQSMDPRMQQQMMQQQMMMQQMMMQMMQQQGGQQPAGAAQQPAAAAPTPTTPEEIQALLDGLDVKLMNGEISEAVHQRMYDKWQQKLDELKGE